MNPKHCPSCQLNWKWRCIFRESPKGTWTRPCLATSLMLYVCPSSFPYREMRLKFPTDQSSLRRYQIWIQNNWLHSWGLSWKIHSRSTGQKFSCCLEQKMSIIVFTQSYHWTLFGELFFQRSILILCSHISLWYLLFREYWLPFWVDCSSIFFNVIILVNNRFKQNGNSEAPSHVTFSNLGRGLIFSSSFVVFLNVWRVSV